MILDVFQTSAFKRDSKKIRDNKKLDALEAVLVMLSCGQELPKKYKNHALIGEYKGYMECHVRPDLLLIYRIEDNALYLYRIGSHSDLF